MEIIFEVFDFVNNGQKRVLYRNTFKSDYCPYDDMHHVFSLLYPNKYISFVLVPPPVTMITKK